MWIADTPQPPYYAAVFSSVRTDVDDGYGEMNDQLFRELAKMPGYLGHESARDGEVGITVSYWSDLEALRNWRNWPLHREAQRMGKKQWYEMYKVRICAVERDYGFGLAGSE